MLCQIKKSGTSRGLKPNRELLNRVVLWEEFEKKSHSAHLWSQSDLNTHNKYILTHTLFPNPLLFPAAIQLNRTQTTRVTKKRHKTAAMKAKEMRRRANCS